MTILPDTPPVGTALSVAAAIRFLKRNGWAQPDADTLIRLPRDIYLPLNQEAK